MTRFRDFLRRLSLSFPLKDHPLHRKEGFRPVFIIGSGRCGSTLLRRILIAGGEIHIPPETYVLGKVVNLYTRFQNARWDDLVEMTLASFEYHPEFDTFGLTLRPLAGRLKEAEPRQRSLAFILDAFYRYHADSQSVAATRWGDKTPCNVECLDRIRSVFPDAHFVHLLRDGTDCIASMMRSMGWSLADSARRWQSGVLACRRLVRDSRARSLEIRYEDLVSEPARTAREVCAFCDLTFSEAMLASEGLADKMGDVPKLAHHQSVKRPISADSVGRGKSLLTPEQIGTLRELIGPTMNECGYSL